MSLISEITGLIKNLRELGNARLTTEAAKTEAAQRVAAAREETERVRQETLRQMMAQRQEDSKHRDRLTALQRDLEALKTSEVTPEALERLMIKHR